MEKDATIQAFALGVKMTLANELLGHLPADIVKQAESEMNDKSEVSSWDIALRSVDILARSATGTKDKPSKKKNGEAKTTKPKTLPKVTIYTDGACLSNPGPGGWGAIITTKDTEYELSGSCESTTNNRMELTGVIRALEDLMDVRSSVDVYMDSQYVVNGIEKGWAESWKKNGWKKADKKPALNPDLWETLLTLCQKHEVRFHWVKGHADNDKNNRCDQLATREAAKAARNKYTTD